MGFKQYVLENKLYDDILMKVPIHKGGKFGIDKKLTDLKTSYSKIKIISSTPEVLITGTLANQVIVNMPKHISDAKDELSFEEKILEKTIRDYNNQVSYYYDKVFKIQFPGEEDSFRKVLNFQMKSIASFIVSISWYKENIK